ncbi:MAG TPA: hypothetical protein VMD02_06205 [Candidatus Omnitrophota bacterium]|nr:hypothetical protein [Candidatus Omnitrophota bacterium]
MSGHDPIAKLEAALKKFWNDYGRTNTVNALHTEIVIEPKFFLNGKLNPEVEDLLISVYLSHTTIDDVKKGKISLRDGVLTVKDQRGKPVAEVRKVSMIQEFTSRLGL